MSVRVSLCEGDDRARVGESCPDRVCRPVNQQHERFVSWNVVVVVVVVEGGVGGFRVVSLHGFCINDISLFVVFFKFPQRFSGV